MHDPDPNQAQHLVAEVFAHAADLAVEPLRQDDPESAGSFGCDPAGQGGCFEDRHTAGHAGEKFFADRAID